MNHHAKLKCKRIIVKRMNIIYDIGCKMQFGELCLCYCVYEWATAVDMNVLLVTLFTSNISFVDKIQVTLHCLVHLSVMAKMLSDQSDQYRIHSKSRIFICHSYFVCPAGDIKHGSHHVLGNNQHMNSVHTRAVILISLSDTRHEYRTNDLLNAALVCECNNIYTDNTWI